MVTASHNPPQDNGYKVYLGDGSQIVPPADAEIAAADRRGRAPSRTCRAATAGSVLGEEVARGLPRRRRRRCRRRTARATSRSSTRRCTASAARSVVEVLARAGLPGAARRRSAQAEPDPDVPDGRASRTPRSPGRWTSRWRSPRRSARTSCSPTTPTRTGAPSGCPDRDGWRMLSGDEVGALLGDFLLRRGKSGHLRGLDRLLVAAGQDGRRGTGSRTSRRSPASSGSAGSRGWPSATRRRSATAPHPDQVRDKDGVSAAIRIVELAALLKAEGRTLLDRLDEIATEYGVHATDQLSVRVDGPGAHRRGDGPAPRSTPPTQLGGLRVEQRRRPRPGQRGPPADRRAALPARRRRPGHRAAVRDRAEDQVLPRGRRPGRRDGRATASPRPGSTRVGGSTRSAATSRRPPVSEPRRRDGRRSIVRLEARTTASEGDGDGERDRAPAARRARGRPTAGGPGRRLAPEVATGRPGQLLDRRLDERHVVLALRHRTLGAPAPLPSARHAARRPADPRARCSGASSTHTLSMCRTTTLSTFASGR